MLNEEQIKEEIKQLKEEIGIIEYKKMNGDPYAPDYVFLNSRLRSKVYDLEQLEKKLEEKNVKNN